MNLQGWKTTYEKAILVFNSSVNFGKQKKHQNKQKNRLAKLSKKYSLLEYCIVLHNLKILCTCLIVFVSSKHLLG